MKTLQCQQKVYDFFSEVCIIYYEKKIKADVTAKTFLHQRILV